MINKYRIWVHRRLILFIFCLLLGLVSSLVISLGGIFPLTVQAVSPSSTSQVISDTAQREQQGREYYETGQFSTAIKIWQQILKVYQSQGDKLNQARVLNNLSLGYQQLGLWSQAKQTITDSLKLLEQKQSKYSSKQLKVLAQALNTQGSLQLATGKSQAAIETWQTAADIYKQAKNEIGVIRSLINKSQGLRSLGLYSHSLSTLTQVEQILQKQPDSALKAAGLRSLGINLRLVRKLEAAHQALQSSLAIAKKVSSPWEITSTLIDLGNLARVQQDTKSAVELYQQAASTAPSQQLKIHAQLNLLSILIDTKQWKQAQGLRSQIQTQIVNLNPNRSGIYAQLNFAESLIRLHQAKIPDSPTITTIAQLIATSEQQAKALGDKQAQAYALGKLGRLYEQTQQWDIAQKLTEKALILAQGMNIPEITYRWQWQLGRIFTAQGNTQAAIPVYNQAVTTLQSLRSDLVTVDSDLQFSFRESVEPVYRELVSLLLQPNPSKLGQKSVKSEPSQKYLIQARQVIESLQVAELDDFFRDACLDTKTVGIDKFDTQAAVIYPIILADRLDIILQLPHQPLRHYSTPIPQKQLETHVEKLRQTLVIRSRFTFQPLSKELYNWLIRPAEKDLANSGAKTLVFVLDGVLRNIPMAILHDGNQYLLEKYSIGLTPGLRLLPPQQLQQREEFKVLGAGLTKARQGFSPLEYVNKEFKEIKSKIPSVVLLNQKFTRENIEKNLQSNSFPIVHIATHGKFSSKALETFILTWDNRIHIQDLDQLLQINKQKSQQAIEMLVLSACETASGDKRAALGLAGIAVKAGARSTLATLWPVNDEATAKLMSRFYEELSDTKQSKVEALRKSQLAMLRDPAYQHPLYWAPYILVGNWL